MIKNQDKILFEPRKYNTVEIWKNVTVDQWNDASWQIKNSIRSILVILKNNF